MANRMRKAGLYHAVHHYDKIFSRSEGTNGHRSSTHYKARKYIALAHTFRARIAMAAADCDSALSELNAAIDVLHAYPAPLQAWKTYAVLGRLQAQIGNPHASRDAFAASAAIVHDIAKNIEEDDLRSIFLTSAAVREVLERVAGQSGAGATRASVD